tara:strand:+ start:4836 stop:4958 length:123 start_codon:yes stop_codon:yes gene_type:complete
MENKRKERKTKERNRKQNKKEKLNKIIIANNKYISVIVIQ